MARSRLLSVILVVGLILGISVLAPSARAQPSPEEFFRQLDSQMSQGLPEDEPGAVIIVSRHGEILFREAYGKASIELDVDLTPKHAFCIASATKPFTATAVMVLVEDGTLSLDDRLAELLDDVAIDPRVTIEHLLTHTSGLPDIFDIQGYGEDAQHSPITPSALSQAANGLDLLFEPGTEHRYSNLGYAILARVVEVSSGTPFERFIQERVFEPAGMTQTMFGGDRLIVPKAVQNYTLSDEGWRHAEPLNYTWGYGLGGMFTTADDLVAFDTALRDGKILKPQTVELMYSAYELPSGEPAEHGLGWETVERGGTRFVYHGGGINGWRAFIVSVPERDVFVAVLSNRDEERTPVGSIAMMVAAQVAAMP